MGYRHRLSSIPKKEYNKIKSLEIEALNKHFGVDSKEYGEIWRGDFSTEIYELGEFWEYSNAPKGSIQTFFKKKDIEAYYNDDTDLKIVTKEFFFFILETYKEKVRTIYKDMLQPFGLKKEDHDKSAYLKSIQRKLDKDFNEVKIGDITLITEEENIAINKLIDHVRTMGWEWGITPFGDSDNYISAINLVDTDKHITSSFKFEYAIFELNRLYKSFDWDKNLLVFTGG